MDTGSTGPHNPKGNKKRFVPEPYVAGLHDAMWKAYEAAGAPFGRCDQGMLIWFEFKQQTRLN